MHPNPVYFISGRTSGFQQWADTSAAGKTTHRLYEYRDAKLDVFLEQVWFEQGQFPGKHHMVIQSHAADVNIDISTYDCHLLAKVGKQRLLLAPTRNQTLVIQTAEGDARIRVANTVTTPVIIQAADGHTDITTGAGISEVFTGAGHARIDVGPGLTFIKTGSASSEITGHTLIDDPHTSVVYARNQESDIRFEQPLEAPLDTLASGVFELHGSDTFKQAVNNHLVFLRHTRCGQQLLEELAKRSWIRITETQQITAFEAYAPDSSESDHHLHQNSQLEWVSGWPAEGGNLAFNLTRSDSDNLPLLDFYRCLCEAYNAFTGTTAPGTRSIETFDGRQIQVAKAHLQAIGLPCGLSFDFDKDPATPSTDTNPSPLNENALRLELGIPLRRHY